MVYRNFDSMPLVLEVSDISDTLKIGRNKAYELIGSGAIKAIKIGNHACAGHNHEHEHEHHEHGAECNHQH